MTELYRGLLMLLSQKFDEMNDAIRKHIRGFKRETHDPDNYLDVGVFGFWNLMLEIVFTLYGIICLTVGIVLISVMAIVFYPCSALLNFAALILHTTKNPSSVLANQPMEESPIIVKKSNAKEKV